MHALIQPVIQFAIWAVVFTPAEYLFCFYPIVLASFERKQNVLLLLFNAYVTAFLTGILAFGIFACFDSLGFVPKRLGEIVGGQPFLLQVVEAALVADLGVYVSHRLSHSRYLWRFHEIHHSAEEMNWLVAFRFHPVDLAIYSIFTSVPVVLMGFSIEAIAIAKAIQGWQSVIVHANTRLGLGPLKSIFVGPKFHHWHHANEQAAYDRNFSGMFVIWDWLFGTLYAPSSERAERFGTDGPQHRSFGDLLLAPFRPSPRVPVIPEVESLLDIQNAPELSPRHDVGAELESGTIISR